MSVNIAAVLTATARRRFVRVALLACLVAALAPAGAAAFSKAIWGPVFRGGVNQFPLYRQLGVSIYETDLNWFEIASSRPHRPTDPNDPAYHWPAGVQQAVDQARAFHIRVLFQVIGTPGWANGGRRWNWAPQHPADYADFAAAAARRYPGVHLWMVWGEPTRASNFSPLTPAPPEVTLSRANRVAPHLYARLLDAAYGALKRVSARNLVIGGSTYSTGEIHPRQWIQNLRLPNGKPPRMDMYGHNPFGASDPSFSVPPSPKGEVQFSDLPYLARWIDRYLRPGMPIFLSEYSIPTAPDGEFGFWVDAPVAARWVRDALRLSRGWSRIYGLGWIHVYDDPPFSAGGLLTAGGRPKPTFGAFAHG